MDMTAAFVAFDESYLGQCFRQWLRFSISSEQDARLFRFSSASSKAVLAATTCSRYSTAEHLHDPGCETPEMFHPSLPTSQRCRLPARGQSVENCCNVCAGLVRSG